MPLSLLIREHGDAYVRDAERVLTFVAALNKAFDDSFEGVLDAYGGYVREQVVLQKAFNKDRTYRHTTVQDVNEPGGDERSRQRYLYTLAFSYVLAPHRYGMYSFLKRALNRHMVDRSQCLEIGTGIGLDTLSVLKAGGQVHTYDLNPLSRQCLEILGIAADAHFHNSVYGFDEDGRYDMCLMIELLEHLENPRAYLEGAFKVLRQKGKGMFSFALRMPQHDHVYLFDSLDQARAMVVDAGFTILDQEYFISSFFPIRNEDREALANDSKHAANYLCVVERP